MPTGVPLPATLPQVPRTDEYQTGARPNLRVFETDLGPPKISRRGTARSKPLTCSFVYTQDQVAEFEDFYEDDLADGSLRMTWTDPLRGDAADWQFYNYSVVPIANSTYFSMSWQLERMP